MCRFEVGRRVLKNLKMVHHASISLRFEFPFESVVKQIPAASEKPDVFRKGGLLPYFLRAGASCYLDWLLPAWQQTGQKIGLTDASGLLAGQVEKEQGREERLMELKAFLQEAAGGTGMPGMEQSGQPEQTARPEQADHPQQNVSADSAQDALIRLQARLKSGYPHQNLAGLYTKTTVSELKKAGMAEAAEEAT